MQSQRQSEANKKGALPKEEDAEGKEKLKYTHNADVGIGEVDTACGGVGQCNAAGGTAGNRNDGRCAQGSSLTGCISRFCRLSTRNNYTAGEQRKGNSNVGAACYRCVGIIFDQVDTGTVEGKVGGSGSMLDAVAAGNPVGSKQHRRAAGYRLLGVIDRVQIAGSIWAGIWVRCRSSRRTWARAAAAGAARIAGRVAGQNRK